MKLDLMYITNNPDVALIAQKAGVDRVWVDLETLGKEERQKGMNTVKSHHTVADVKKISSLLTTAKMQVRINPWNQNSKREIDEVILSGAQYIMLPMWKSVYEVEQFAKAVAGRAKTILLLETKEAEECLDEALKVSGIDEIHIGLNDLHLSYGLAFMFELLSNGTVERICKKIERAALPYGFGGVSHLGDGMIPAEMIIKEHYRLGSTRAILSRGFCDISSGDLPLIERTFVKNLSEFREFERSLSSLKASEFEENRQVLKQKIELVAEAKRNG